MHALDVIVKKRNGEKLTRKEIDFFVQGVTRDEIADYQAAAFLMAVYFRGMDDDETLWLTQSMLHSGDVVDLSCIPGIKTDKHSTGGVGDKTTLIIGPIVAACGVPVAKMSGRGLGHTGGTIDKLEAIPGFRTNLTAQEFTENVRDIGLAVAGQTGNLAPADKKFYALRDVTGTIENVSLIAASIMSKKLACGTDAIVLDVKTGSGAFMKTVEQAKALAGKMVEIGRGAGKRVTALITEMDRPLGLAIGNALEVMEAIKVLKGQGPEDLKEVSIELAANMLMLGGKGDLEHCRKLALQAVSNGSAFNKFTQMILRQGGDPAVAEDPSRLPWAPVQAEWRAEKAGYIQSMQAEKLGAASLALGAGRKTKSDSIDPAAGIVLVKTTGDRVEAGEPLAVLHTSDKTRVDAAIEILRDSLLVSDEPAEQRPLILGFV
ncbi:MAG: thymidine phosphorylase [Ruminiclostridium sp.]|nr:thymidine phosphorylase [Ruminiclostridium sp.]